MTATSTRPQAPAGQGARPPLLPEGWLRALVAALEAVLLGWLVCVIPAIAAYVATAASPALGESTWQSALGVGSAGWLLGHGAPAGTLSLVPLGLSAVFAAMVMVTARRHVLHGGAHLVGAIGYVGMVQLVSLLSPFAVDHLRLLAGSAVVAAVGAGWSWWRTGARTAHLITDDAEAAPSDSLRHRSRLIAVRAVRGAAGALGVLVALGLVLVVAAVVLHLDRVTALHQSYEAGIVGGTVLVLGQLAYLPTAGVWALSYVAGPGFAVGDGTTVSAASVELGAVPGIPLLGALPQSPSPMGVWPVLAVVLAGALAAWWMARPGQAHRLVDAVAAALGTTLVVGAAVLVSALASTGAIGTGRMATLGPDALLLTGLVTVEVGLGAVLTTVAIHPRTRAVLGSGVSSLSDRLGRDDDAQDADGTGSGRAGSAAGSTTSAGSAATTGSSTKGTSSGSGTSGKGSASGGSATGGATTGSGASTGAGAAKGGSASRSKAANPSTGGSTSKGASASKAERSAGSGTGASAPARSAGLRSSGGASGIQRWSVTGSMARSSTARGSFSAGGATSGPTG